MSELKSGVGIIPSLDVDMNEAIRIVEEVDELDCVHAYKIGALLVEAYGLPNVVVMLANVTGKPLVYDKQKFGTDIPPMCKRFLENYNKWGVNYTIVFPQAGIETLKTIAETAKGIGADIIVGGLMTHKGFTSEEGGYIPHELAMKTYEDAAKLGVTDYVVPGNKPEEVCKIRKKIEKGLDPDKHDKLRYWAPGFVTQGGTLEDARDVFGNSEWKAIIGSGIYGKPAGERASAVQGYAKLI